MTQIEQQRKAKAFAKEWKDKGYEKGESQTFWLELLESVYDVETPSTFIKFEDKVILDHTAFIDAYIPSTKVLIEQKSINKDLRKPIRQSDGSLLTPFQQAKKYITELPLSKHPRWVVTCNFKSFLVYDMENPNSEPDEILLENFGKEYYRLSFITEEGSVHLKKELETSKKAGDLIGEIYDAILARYSDAAAPSAETLKSLNMLCVRIVFCLYAEDAGILGHKNIFGDYLRKFEPPQLRRAVLDLFRILDTPIDKRDRYLEEDLAAFPYVNGGLFTEEDQTIPQLTAEIKDLLTQKASGDFDWSTISPTIFGAIFESTLNPETRRSGGMHYTSIENIHKVIDPLFLNQLKAELEEIKQLKQKNIRNVRIVNFQKKLGSLKFLDPACGSGNFLTETYISLRRMENECIKLQLGITQDTNFGWMDVFEGTDDEIVHVNINQFYGIEINDFAVSVAKTALWIAESQMMKETAEILKRSLDFLPLKSYTNISEGDALKIDWEDVVSKKSLNYIMGNPPFVGFTYMTGEQKRDMELLFPGIRNIDFVAGWFKKANDYIRDTDIECAFVSTNSITQGETVARFWERMDSIINFAYRTFRWDSEANIKAHVHCVIIGFARFNRKEKLIFSDNKRTIAKNINGYLMDAPNLIIESRPAPLCSVKKMIYGNKPTDDSNFILTTEEKEEVLKKEPELVKWLRPFIGAEEFLNNRKRWCFWLKDASPSEIKKSRILYSVVENVRTFRLSSVAKTTRDAAAAANRFRQITQPDGVDFLLIPRTSSEKRRYIPIGFMTKEYIVSDAVQIIPGAGLYDFGILTSSLHMAWMRAICGRLESRYRYSKDVVYNNFPWPEAAEEEKKRIEETAEMILEARSLYPDSSLSDLYDDVTMPVELRKAHLENDRAVMKAYRMSEDMTENDSVIELFKLYAGLLEK